MKPFANSSALSCKAEVFRKKAEAADEWGNPAYESAGVFWCGAKDRAGSETLITSQNKRVSTAKTTFTFRANKFTEAITPDMRIFWRGADFNIISGPIYSDDRNFLIFEAVREF